MSYYSLMDTGAVAGPGTAEDLPAWERWTDADDQACARLRDSSPPVVLRGVNWADLRGSDPRLRPGAAAVDRPEGAGQA